jgi:hypothetical protein
MHRPSVAILSGMAYHETFWITVTAAAPVLALTYVVSTGAANRFDHEVTDLGIWGTTKAQVIILLSLLGFIACAVDFVWGILSLISGRDLGPLAVPAVLIILSFLMVFVLAVLEMRAYSWLRQCRYDFGAAQRIAIFPEALRDVGAIHGGNIYWPLSAAKKAVDAVANAGFLVTGLDVRQDEPDGSWTKYPLGRYGFAAVDDARAAAINDLRAITSPDAFIEIIWSSR